MNILKISNVEKSFGDKKIIDRNKGDCDYVR